RQPRPPSASPISRRRRESLAIEHRLTAPVGGTCSRRRHRQARPGATRNPARPLSRTRARLCDRTRQEVPLVPSSERLMGGFGARLALLSLVGPLVSSSERLTGGCHDSPRTTERASE